MKIKIRYIFILLICIICSLAYRYEEINKGIPNSYEEQVYKVNEEVDLDNSYVKVNSYEILEAKEKIDNTYKMYTVYVDMEVHNNSSDIIDASWLVENSRLSDESFGNLDIEFESNDNNVFDKRIKSLEPNESVQVRVRYCGSDDSFDFSNKLKIYISKNLYENQIRDKYEQGKFYSKSIEL